MHGGKSWGAIAALVPGRTKGQCHSRWKDVLRGRLSKSEAAVEKLASPPTRW
jgi:hypothetical protein